MEAIPHVLTGQPADLAMLGRRTKLNDLRRLAKWWQVGDYKNLDQDQLVAQVHKALNDRAVAPRVIAALPEVDREALQAYRRYGAGLISGAVMRMDLLARGILRIRKPPAGQNYYFTAWETNPTERLSQLRCLLFAKGFDRFGITASGAYDARTANPLPTMALNPALEEAVQPAGPPPWEIDPTLDVVSLGQPRSSGEVAFELSQVLGGAAGRKSWRMNRSGELSTPARQALAKAVPLPDDREFPLPDRQVFYFELLRSFGAIEVVGEYASVNPGKAQNLFGLPTVRQAHEWATAWLRIESWRDGYGTTIPHGRSPYYSGEATLWEQRHVLAWALASLAHQGPKWFDLHAFLKRIGEDGGSAIRSPYVLSCWAWSPPSLNATNDVESADEEPSLVRFLKGDGCWFANAIMVTFAALGFIERGRAVGATGRYCFRLTPLGLAVFGAPEVEFEAQTTSKFLVVQPNFDVVMYLDRTDAQTLGCVGLILENIKPTSGPVQTARITPAAFYRGLELGLSFERIVESLEQWSQHALPANVIQTLGDWAARRESLVVHRKVALIGFPDTVGRAAYLEKSGGRPCGDRWVIAEAGQLLRGKPLADAITNDHGVGRRVLEVDERGNVTHCGPLTAVESGRLRMFAEQEDARWRLTSTSLKRSVERGLNSSQIGLWLSGMLAKPMPDLMWLALEAWTEKLPPLQLGNFVLLGIPNEAMFATITRSELFRPLLLGTLGTGWLLVRPESSKALAKLLQEYGFEVTPPNFSGMSPPKEDSSSG
jgi:hypothetical protein